jgi:hypothetical protein
MSARCITLCGEKVLTKNNNLYISTLFQFVVIVVLYFIISDRSFSYLREPDTFYASLDGSMGGRINMGSARGITFMGSARGITFISLSIQVYLTIISCIQIVLRVAVQMGRAFGSG